MPSQTGKEDPAELPECTPKPIPRKRWRRGYCLFLMERMISNRSPKSLRAVRAQTSEHSRRDPAAAPEPGKPGKVWLLYCPA